MRKFCIDQITVGLIVELPIDVQRRKFFFKVKLALLVKSKAELAHTHLSSFYQYLLYQLLIIIYTKVCSMEADWKVIIVGAGMAGIGASSVFTKQNVPHLMLESRDRVGGRIFSSQFDGVTIEEGASFVHSPHFEGHLINNFIKKSGIETFSAQFHCESYFYENEHILSQKHINRAWTVYEQFQKYLEKENQMKNEDFSVAQIFYDFLSGREGLEEHVKNTLRWIVNIHSNIEGCDLDQLSLKDYAVSECESQHDYLPVKGYSFVMSKLFEECNPELKLEHRVIEVDYSGSEVKVTTAKGIFKGKYIINALPLGILQQDKVVFRPELPPLLKQKLRGMGNGVANKFLISCQTPFWGKHKGWINFITKSKNNPYPIGYVLPEKNRHILCVFVSGSYSLELSKMSDEEAIKHFCEFVGKFMKEEVKVRAFKLTRWQEDSHALGSYSYCSVGHQHQSFSELMSRPVEGKMWFAGEYMHPDLNGCAHAAFETGVRAAEQIVLALQAPL